VYAVTPDMAGVALRWGTGWRAPEEGFRWASSPATLRVTAPASCRARLVVVPALIHDPTGRDGLGAAGVLRITSSRGGEEEAMLSVDRPASVPIALEAGDQELTLTLQAGNFRPSDYGHDDDDVLSFAVRSIDMALDDMAQGCGR
jgi:hypothetical protein